MVAFFPDDDLVVSFLSNAEITHLPTNILYYIADWRIHDLHAKIEKGNFPNRIEGKPNSHSLVEYTGEYINSVLDKIVVTVQKDGSLLMKVGTLETKLEHRHYDSFKGYVQDFAIIGNVFTFFTGSDGRVDLLEATLVMGSGPEMYKKVESLKLNYIVYGFFFQPFSL
ncbi:hypothetical protein BGZ47_001302 [Haplosporangium gracile]|nr:hypothetical protein BGZ47_001302 [Haplosporangium gracile]